MYRLFIMFKYFTYNLSLSLMVITLTRNLAYVIFLLHWWGAAGVARVAGGSRAGLESARAHSVGWLKLGHSCAQNNPRL
jgi:hypothetical protein